MPRAIWTHTVDHSRRLIRVVDVGHSFTRSVTNDAERVVRRSVELVGPLEGYRVIYQDSQAHWDEILVRDDRFAGFAPIRDGIGGVG